MLADSQRIFGLDIVRASAILLVLISHCTLLAFPEIQSGLLMDAIRGFGAFGVDIFFVLSGYLIGGIILKMIQKNETSLSDLWRFWKRRWYRTLPNYFLVLIINIILGLLLGTITLGMVSEYFLFLQNFISPHPDFFTEAWSLSIEEYAYLSVPLLLFAIFNFTRGRNHSKMFLIVLIVVYIILYLVKLNYYLNTEIESYKMWSTSFRKVVIYRLDAIYFGFILVYIMDNFKSFFNRFKLQLAIVGIGLFLLIHLLISFMGWLPHSAPGFFVFGYLQLLALCVGLIFPYMVYSNFKSLPKRLIVYISLRSYALYLINYSIVLLSFQFLLDMSEYSIALRLVITLIFLLISFGLAHIMFKYFEKPILLFRDRNIKR